MPIFDHYPNLSGCNPRFTGLANILTAAGIVAPHNGKPFSEAMLLGISGGLGCGYILWEFKSHGTATLTTGFTYRWNYLRETVEQTVTRAGGQIQFRETGGAKAAAKHLDEALDSGKIPLALLDPFYLPYRGVPNHLEGCGGIEAPICGRDGDNYLIHDRGIFPVSAEAMSAARGRVGTYKNRLVLVEPGTSLTAEAAIKAGLADCVRYLSESSTSFSIPAVAKWAKMVTDSKNKKGWRKVFAEGRGLYSTLVATYLAIEQEGTGGLRGLYADFLNEAGSLVPGLEEAEVAYRTAAKAWTAVAETAIAPFPDMRGLCDRRSHLLGKGDSDGLAEVNTAIEGLRTANDGNTFEPAGLFEELQQGLKDVVAAEKSALACLEKTL